MLDNEQKKKANKAISRTNKLKTGLRVAKGVKAISNALGTKPTDTPEVNTKYEQLYTLDEDGMGHLS